MSDMAEVSDLIEEAVVVEWPAQSWSSKSPSIWLASVRLPGFARLDVLRTSSSSDGLCDARRAWLAEEVGGNACREFSMAGCGRVIGRDDIFHYHETVSIAAVAD